MTGKKIFVSTMIVLFVATMCGVQRAYSTPVLDQFFEPTSLNLESGIGNTDKAQTFTVGVSGILTSVDVLVRRFGGDQPDLWLDIRGTSDGIPNESDSVTLASATLAADTISTTFEFISIDISSFGVQVTGGDVLAIVLRSDAPFGTIDAYRWGGVYTGDPYPPGSHFYRHPDYGVYTWTLLDTGGDLAFRTFVIPEPATLFLFGLGGLILRRKRRAK